MDLRSLFLVAASCFCVSATAQKTSEFLQKIGEKVQPRLHQIEVYDQMGDPTKATSRERLRFGTVAGRTEEPRALFVSEYSSGNYTGYSWDGSQWVGTDRYDYIWFDGPIDPDNQYTENMNTDRMTYKGNITWLDGRCYTRRRD